MRRCYAKTEEKNVSIRNLAQDVLFVLLPPEPDLCAELKRLNEQVSTKCDFHVIVDLSRVEIITSPGISNLLILRKWLKGAGRRLILCGVRFATKCVFKLAALDTVFEFAEDKDAALAALGADAPVTAPTS